MESTVVAEHSNTVIVTAVNVLTLYHFFRPDQVVMDHNEVVQND